MGPLKNDEGELVQKPDRIADSLYLQYSSVYTVPSEVPTSSDPVVPVTTENIKFDIADIAQAVDIFEADCCFWIWWFACTVFEEM